MRLLVMGGSWFLGRALVDAARLDDHEVTVFNRGQSAPSPAGVRRIRGDRTSATDLARLATSGRWDAVLDVHGVVPAHVNNAARALRPAAARYVFVSSVSAYRDWPAKPVAEDSPLHDGDPYADPGDWRWGTGVYGPLKAGAEAAVRMHFPVDRTVVVRPGVILGPYEYGGRLTWWLRRAARGGRVLAPAPPDSQIRPVDVRDVARFILTLLGTDAGGTFNVAGPAGRDTFADLITGCLDVAAAEGLVSWVDGTWLSAQGVRQWTELPMWRTQPGTWAIDTTKSAAAGLVCRPLRETIADTWSWMQAGGEPVPDDRQTRHGIDPDREAQLLDAWKLTTR